jgi:hypothetical protein
MGLGNFSKIILDLTQNPKSIIESISERKNMPKETVQRIIYNLVDEGVVVKQMISDEKYYSLSKAFLNIRSDHISDVYFNFNLKQEHIDKIHNLFAIIENYLLSTVQKKPGKVQMQKIVVKINNKLHLGLPLMWYKYGQMTPLSYNPDNNYSEIKIKEYYNDRLDEIYLIITEDIVSESNLKSAKILKKEQHDENPLYRKADEILEKIYAKDFNFVENNMRELMKLIPYFKDNYNVINSFYDFTIYFTKMYNKNKDYKLQSLFVEAYTAFWDYIAIHNCINDMKQYYIENNLNLEELSTNTFCEINEIKERFNDVMDRFYEKFNLIDFIDNEETKKLFNKVMTK